MIADVERLLRIARAEIGNTEWPAGSNTVKYNEWFYGRTVSGDGYPWCMAFVQWCYDHANKKLPYTTASCSALLKWYMKNSPERVFITPQPGDIVIYSFGHTGIVESVGDSTITAIEGNTSSNSSGNQSNGGGVFRRTRKKSLVTAYLRPIEEEKKEDTMTGKEIYDTLQAYLKEQPVPDWAKDELQEAMEMGITDGTNGMQLIPRYQAAIMAKRAVEFAGKLFEND